MAACKRTKRRTWITDQLFTRTKTPIFAVQWYELGMNGTSEVEVVTRGRKIVRRVENIYLDDERQGRELEKLVEELVKEIDETP